MNIDHCTSFTALGDYLMGEAARSDLKQAECKQLYTTIEKQCRRHHMNDFLSGHSHWYIGSETDAVYTYLYRNWRFQRSIKANRDYLLRIAEHLQQDFFCADGTQITVQEATHIMSTLDECYNFSKKVLGDSVLFLLLPQDAHKTYDAICRPYAAPDGEVNCDIIMPHIQQDVKTHPGSMLLHELGHLLNIKLTGSLQIIPELFIQLDRLLRNEGIESTTEELSELFAHLFAMTMLQLPDLKQYDSYPPLPDETVSVFAAYFKTLLAAL